MAQRPGWLGKEGGWTDGQKQEFLPILLNFAPYRGRWPITVTMRPKLSISGHGELVSADVHDPDSQVLNLSKHKDGDSGDSGDSG